MPSWNQLVSAARIAAIPAPALRAVTLAQWALESGRGTSRLASEHGNFAGLKWRPEMQGFATPVQYAAHDGVDTYCAFASAEAFIAGYWRFIARAPYQGWQDFAQDPPGYVAFLKARGYAGDPGYTAKVLAVLPEAERLLADTGGGDTAGGDVGAPTDAERPGRREIGESAADRLPADRTPRFVTLGEVRHRFRGARPNGLEGAIVHYDAGRSRPRTGTDDLEHGARSTLRHGQTAGFAYATISRSGIIYLPGNMDWESWGAHAGNSLCPDTRRGDVSRFYVGFEVNAPGWLHPTTTPDTYAPWFNCRRDQDGNVITNGQGQATIVDASDETYRTSELRIVAQQQGNIAAGAYTRYTDAQHEALVAVMLWLRGSFPGSFRLDRVYGHDEVSPRRKVDPGASLGETPAGPAVTMAEFRRRLLHAWADLQG
jgi:hypothetical protein